MIEENEKSTGLRLTSGNLLARNVILNLLGQGLPLLTAVFTIPLLVKGLGMERFGLLTLSWAIIGYLSLFDLGLGRVLTKIVAQKLGCGREDEIPVLVWTCFLLMLILGAIATILSYLLFPWLVNELLKVPDQLQPEALRAFIVLGISIPVVISTAALRGILEAQQRFELVNVVFTANGLFTFLGPLLTLSFSSDLSSIVTVLAIGRLFIWLVYLLLCFQSMPSLLRTIKFRFNEMPAMISLGSWMTVSSIISPIMLYLDRFLIGALISVSAVAFYTIPYEVVVRFGIIGLAVGRVLFPAFATCFAADHGKLRYLFIRWAKLSFVFLFPIIMVVITLAGYGLEFWLGKEFAHYSTRVLQWLAIGVLFNGLAQVPFALIQAAGRADLTAKVHLIELPLYVFSVWWMTHTFGIEGAAIAWLARMTVDAVVLFEVTKWLLRGSIGVQHFVLMLGAAAPCLALGMLQMSINLKVYIIVFVMIAFGLGTWFLILSSDERNALMNWAKRTGLFKCRRI